MRPPYLLLYLKAVECSFETVLKEEVPHKREVKCPPEEYFATRHCCQLCNAGSYAESECTVEHGSPTCKSCTRGEDYMDKPNGYAECIRCTQCDAGHGQILLESCDITHNTSCTCMDNYFCNQRASGLPESCSQCLPCKTCTYGVIQECTPAKDAVCKENHARGHWGIIPAVLIVVIAICSRNVFLGCPPEFEDVDLRQYLVDIANKLTYEIIKTCVQKMNCNSVDIQDIDYSAQSVCDRKYKLLESWYQGHGKKGAFKELYETLQSCNKQLYAEDILTIVKADNLNNTHN
ncbi:tumor necrosis factor receptor superfamily member 6 [Spea bombifrons]|uniref:tumor necrosis factor receptor superfamily member 6 n=1 Tax=Spea bombifrons TaxID=233779 RepID=UPI002349575D|nr:tumor necrosis factor receptor superfamily member 6 [Spea bombifrons]